MSPGLQRDIRVGIAALDADAFTRIPAVVAVFILLLLILPPTPIGLLMAGYVLGEFALFRLQRACPDRIDWSFTVRWLLLVELCNICFLMTTQLISHLDSAAALALSVAIIGGAFLHATSVKAVSRILGYGSLLSPGVASILFVATGFDGSAEWYALVFALMVMFGYTAVTNQSIARTRRMLTTARRRADAASEAKGRFLAAMSHEIRTPLNAIIGLAEVIETRGPCAQDKGDARMVRTSGEHLRHMLDDVLDHAKLSAGEMSFARVPFNPGALARDVAGLFAGRISQKSLDLNVEVDPRLPAHILGDPTRIRQVITNLMSNAIKFTDAGGITLRVRWMQGDRVVFRVADTGCGIDAAAQATLFRDFAQVDPNRERAAAGTGLGLAISRNLARGMGGDLTVESTPGRGACFSMVLPAERAGTAGDVDFPQQIADLNGWAILVVDDSAANRVVVRRLLAPTGATVIEARNGQDALDLIAAAPDQVDLVLLDMNMPVMDGPDFVAALNRQRPCALRPKIVVLTANSAETARAAFDPADLDGCATKPLTRTSLLGTFADLGLTGPKPAPRKI